MGPSHELVRVVAERLVESGWQPTDSVVLAAAGASDPGARRDLRVTAALLSAALGQCVELAYAATGEPSAASAVAEPIGTHPGVVRLVASRFRRPLLPVSA
jgi:sirohydrochlorin ferrochelatase